MPGVPATAGDDPSDQRGPHRGAPGGDGKRSECPVERVEDNTGDQRGRGRTDNMRPGQRGSGGVGGGRPGGVKRYRHRLTSPLSVDFQVDPAP